MAILGDALAEIAREKAGIIKDGVPAVVSSQSPEAEAEAMPEIRHAAHDRQAPLIEAGKQARLRLTRQSLEGSMWEARWAGGTLKLRCRSFGPTAQVNLTTVLAAVEALRGRGFDLPDSAVKRGLEDWTWPGRLEVVSPVKPAIVLDGAHNPLEARALRSAIDGVLPGRAIHWILAMLGDKDVRGVLKELVGGRADDRVTAFPAPSPRAKRSCDLARHALDFCGRVACRPNVEEALRLALAETPDGPVVIAGSLYIIDPARKALKKIRG
jgi:dihydrofolate synthase/folylpolyglutamate synthase